MSADFLYGILTGASGVFILSGAVLAVLIRRAPEGYELPGIGFRYGPEPVDDAARRLPDADGFRAPVRSFHRNLNSPEGQHDHA